MKLIATIDVKERVIHLEQEGFGDGEELSRGFYYLATCHSYIPCVGRGRNSLHMLINPNLPSINLNDVKLSLKELQKFCETFRIDLVINFPKRMEM